MATEGILATLHKVATALHRLDDLTEDVSEFRQLITARIERLDGELTDARERIARLEATREADLAKLQAEASRFMAEVERAELRIAKQLPKPSKKKPQA
jgi:chromosome segregation ATPase